ncbi:MAG: phosphatase PAP2 family protein [Prolixibacteraceae bacterium]|nr:phosphatase PAP2 family protein [Prolixibacteraceae bacterium]
MNKILKHIPGRDFLLLFFLFWLTSVILLIITDKDDIELFINSLSIPVLDKFFYGITFLGHGVFASIILILMLLKNYYHSLYLFFTLILVAVFSNLFKRIIFFQHLRPMWNMYYDDLHRIIIDAPVNYLRSFPSGHAMTVFAVAFILAVVFNKRIYTYILFFLAVIVCISRIYLLQHYFADIVWGSFIGITSAYLGIILTDYFFILNKEKLLKSSLLTRLKRGQRISV